MTLLLLILLSLGCFYFGFFPLLFSSKNEVFLERFFVKLLFIKHMRLIGVVFYLDLNNRLESMWSPDIFGDNMMATNNAVMQEDRILRQIASTHYLERQL